LLIQTLIGTLVAKFGIVHPGDVADNGNEFETFEQWHIERAELVLYVEDQCHNPSFGLATKAKGITRVRAKEDARELSQEDARESKQRHCKSAGQEDARESRQEEVGSHITYSREC
jgi:hypothetical protein